MDFSLDVMILLAIIVLAIVLFTLEILPLEVTAMGVTGLLMLFDILTPEQAISGFSNKAVITIGAIFIISRALVKTGFLEVFADYLYKKAGKRKWLTIFIFLFTVAIMSGFINNTAAVIPSKSNKPISSPASNVVIIFSKIIRDDSPVFGRSTEKCASTKDISETLVNI